MQYGIERAEREGRPVEYRQLPEFMLALNPSANPKPRKPAGPR